MKDNLRIGWFSVGICKYKLGYKSPVIIQVISLVEKLLKKNPLQDLLFSLNAVISTNESTRFITVHVLDLYTYKFRLKTT